MSDAPRLRLSQKEMDRLWNHYTGNCFSCPRCSLFDAIRKNERGAVEEYVRYMREEQGVTVKTEAY